MPTVMEGNLVLEFSGLITDKTNAKTRLILSVVVDRGRILHCNPSNSDLPSPQSPRNQACPAVAARILHYTILYYTSPDPFLGDINRADSILLVGTLQPAFNETPRPLSSCNYPTLCSQISFIFTLQMEERYWAMPSHAFTM